MIVITNTYTQEDWEALSELEEGDVAKIQEPFVEFETVVEMSARYAPNIEWCYIMPGTELFTQYGSSHCVVISN
jgi:hypothetical protein